MTISTLQKHFVSLSTSCLQGEEDYLDALRAYANTLYQRVLPSPDLHFLDKTPENVRFWPFLLKLFPHARYIVLTRHPAAIMHSVATSFSAVTTKPLGSGIRSLSVLFPLSEP